jgi:hypothetical protein
MRKSYLLLIAVLLCSIGSFAATWYSQGTGDPNVLANWNSLAGGGGATPTSFTTAGDIWNMQTNMTSPNPSPWTLSQTSTLNVNGVTWGIGGLSSLTVGNLNITGSSYLSGSGTAANNFYIYGDLTISGASYITNPGGSYANYLWLSNTASTLAAPQHISVTTSSASNVYTYLEVQPGVTGQLSANLTFSGTGPWCYMNGTLDCQNYTFGGNLGISVNSGGTIYTANSGGIVATVITTGTKSFSTSASYGFNGTAAQVTSTSLPASLLVNSKLIINNPAGVTLSQSTTLNNTAAGLTLTNGVLSTGTYTLTVPGNAAAVTGAGANSYVKGTLLKSISGATTVNYEVGDVNYAPMSLAFNVPGSAGSIAVKTTNGLHPQVATSNINSAAMVNHYWTITNSGAAGPTTVTPKVTYNAGDILGGGSNSAFVTNEYNGSAWLPTVLFSTNTGTPYTTTPQSSIALSSLAGDYIFGAPVPTVFTSAPTMDFGLVGTGLSSTSQFFNLTGLSLSSSSSVTITAPANFQVSSDNTTWVSSYSLPYPGTSIASTPVYVRFNPTAATAYTGTVTVTGGGLAATANLVSLTGSGATACSGVPTSGTASMTPGAGGTSTPFTLSLTGATTGGSIIYQWQSSISSTSGFTDIAGATTSNYNFTGIGVSSYYRALVTCPSYSAAMSNTVAATFSMTATYLGVVGTYTVPVGVTSIRIQASGAQGGAMTSTYPAAGGSGAIMQGDFCVTPGQVLAYIVGGQGATANYSGGGGGGSFVWDNATGTPLIAAGGGGGAAYNSSAGAGVGINASTGLNGTFSGGGVGYNGAGIAGNGGTVPTSVVEYAAGGAGWLSNGAAGVQTVSCTYGNAVGGVKPLAGGLGGQWGSGSTGYNGAGGFGGGGGAQGACSTGSGGGGGGYSGGAGGAYPASSLGYGGGGGGSLNTGVNQVNSVGNTGNGSVVFSIPTIPAGGASPATLSFGPQLLGLSSAPQTTTFAGVVLTPGATINITSSVGFDISIDGGATWLLNPVATTYTASSCVNLPIQVRFSPTTTGSYTGTLTISGGGLPSTVNVPLSGIGIIACAGAPTAGTITMFPIGGGTSTTFNMSVTGYSLAAGIVFQWQSSPDSTTWSNIAGATNTSYSTSGITATTYFRCNVTCTNSFISVATNFLTANFLASVCTPSFTNNGCTNNMVIGSLTNPFLLTGSAGTSITDITNCSASGYIDETGSGYTATMNPGSTYSVRIGSNTTGPYQMSDQIWIDFNNNGTFEASESIGGALWGTLTYTHSITIPSTATPGVYRMRVVADYAPSCAASGPCYPNVNPCPLTGVVGYGDVRDYVITIAPTPSCVAPANQPTGLTLSQSVLTTINGSFTAPSPVADGYLVVMTTSSVAPTAPVNGTAYTAGTSALGGTILSAGAGTTFTAAGVTPGSQYWFWVYAYTQFCTPGVPPIYKTTTPLTGTFAVPSCATSGVKVVGPTGDYPTIAAALNALSLTGIAGPTAIELQTTYTGEAYPIAIGTYPCISATNNITIRPQGTMTVTANAAGPMFNLNGALNIIIDGRVGSTGTTKALTLINNNTTGIVAQFINDASYNKIKYTTLLGSNTAYTAGVITFGTTTGTTGCNYNTIDNCNIMDAPAGTPATCIYIQGTNGKENKYDTVSNCNIANYYSPSTTNDYGIYVGGASAWTFNNNRLYQTAARSYTNGYNHVAMNIIPSTAGSGFIVTNNTVGYSSSAGTGYYTMTGTGGDGLRGIYLSVGNSPASSVQGNTVTNWSITSTSASAAIAYPIYISSGSVNVGDVTPNIVGSGTGTGAITVTNATTITSQTLYGIYVSASSPAAVNIQNNIVGSLSAVTTGTVSASGACGIYVSGSPVTTITGNTIGSTTTPNSINALTTTTGVQQVYGIYASISSSTAVSPIISNNTIANLNNNSTSASAYTYGFSFVSTANGTISNNTIYNISGTSLATGFTAQPGVGGISHASSGTPTYSQNTIYNIANNNGSTTATNAVGIYYTGGTNGIIDRNKIYDIRNASTGASIINPPTADGIFLVSPGTAVTITNNMISLGNSRTTNTSFTGILAANSVAYTLKAYYNSVNIEGTAAAGSTMHTAAFNRGNFSATAFATPTVDLRNNIFVNNRTNVSGTAVHYAIGNSIGAATSNAGGWATNASNYNILNAANTANIGYWNTSKTFGSWQTAAVSDANSYGIAAPAATITFTNSAIGDLHVNMGTTANYIESHGTPISGLAYDYDNDMRPGPVGSVNGGGTLPDIGADESDGVPQDNLPPVITYNTFTPGCGTGDRVFTATITDFTGVKMANPQQPQVYFHKNGGAWAHAAGTLSSGNTLNGVWSFTVSASAMLPTAGLAVTDVVQYYVTAQDTFAFVSANPSPGFAATDVNTVTAAPTTPNGFTITPTMSGTYTVSATGGDYTTITAAANAYNAACISGPVTFILADASYPGETFPITIAANSSASSVNTLTIKPAAGVNVTITGSAVTPTSPAIFRLQNASNVTIDGLNTGGASLTLNNPNTTTTSADIWLASSGLGCKNIALKNMTMYASSNSTNSYWNIIAAVDGGTPISGVAGADNDSVTIQGNTFLRAGYGIFAIGTAATSAGGLDGWNITNNTFGPALSSPTDNLSYNGCWLGTNMLYPTISNNTFRNIGTNLGSATVAIGLGTNITGALISKNNINGVYAGAGQVCGIYMQANITNATITQNTITNLASAGTSSGAGSNAGILVGTSSGVAITGITITRNNISNIANTGLSSTCYSSGRGIIISTGTPSGNNVLVANNMISNVYGLGCGSIGYGPAGIDIEGASGGIKIYDNTVNLNTSYPGSSNTANSAAFLNNSSAGNFDVRGNIFTNTYVNTAYVSKHYAFYSTATPSGYVNLNYNAYYANSAAGSPLGYTGSTDRMALSDLQTAIGGDANSIVALPQFVSTTDAHLVPLAQNVPLVHVNTALTPTVTVDYDSTVRSTTAPGIGAHEVSIPTCSSITAGPVTQSVPVCGSGSTTLTAASATSGIGASYQWRTSTDGVNYTNIAGATNSSYISPSISVPTYYRIVATCSPISSSDSTTKTLTINPTPAAIAGGSYVCLAGTTSLTDATTGGTWASSTPSAVSIGTSGVVTGNTAGSATITYTAPTGCQVFNVVNVNTFTPTFTLAGAPATICSSFYSSTLTATGTIVNGYTVNSVPYAPLAFTPSAVYSSTTSPTAGTNDNGYYSAVIPFAFTIYNTLYPAGNSVYIGTNGFLSFSTTGMTNSSISTFPSTSFAALISAIGRDLNMPVGDAVGNIKWGVVGTAPNRKFVASWNCNDANYPSIPESAQVIMEEGTNAVEVHVTNQNAATHTIGLQNAAGNLATTAPGHQSSPTPITNSAWRFTPWATSYVWSPSSFLSATTGTSVVASNVTTTPSVTYTVNSSFNACASSNTVTLTVNPSPNAITGTATACVAGTSSLSEVSTGGVWSSSTAAVATVGTDGTVTAGSTVGTATISYTAAGCSATKVFSTTAAPGIITGTATVCTGLTTTLANSGGAGTWTSGSANATVTNGVVTGVNAGTATISYVNSCGSPVTIIVTVLQTPAAITGTTNVCPGAVTTLADVNTGGSWSSPSANVTVGSSNGAVTGVTTGTAAVTYDLGNGCPITSTVVTVNLAPAAPTFTPGGGASTICLTKSSIFTASITPAIAGTTYAWSGISGAVGLTCATCNVNTITPTATGANTYSVVASTPAGCVASNIVTVNVNPLPPAITGSSTMCAGGSVGLNNTLGGGTWASSNTGVAIVVSNTGSVTGMTAGTSIISYNAPTGCFSTTIVTVQATPVAAPTNSAPICNGGTVTLTANPSGGANTYAWSGPGLFSSTAANPTTTPTTTAVYSLTVTNGTAIPGCAPTTVYTTSVTVNSTPTAAPTNSGPICVNGTVTLTANPGGSTSAYTWSGLNLSSTTAANPTATLTTTSTYTLVSTSTGGASGCASTYTTSVTVNGLPTVASISPSVTSLCPGGAVIFTAGAVAGTGSVVRYNWSGPNGYSATTAVNSSVFTPTTTASSGAYSVAVVYSASGCTSNPVATSPAVTVNALPTVASITPSSTTPCTGSALTLTSGATTGTGAVASYNWSGPNSYSTSTTTPSAVLSPTTTAASGIYSLTVTYPGPGCISTPAATPTITFANGPVLAGTSNSGPVCVGGTLNLTANTPSNVTSYSWAGPVAITSGGATANATVTPASLAGNGIYTVTVTNSATSCVNTYTTSVTVNQVASLAGGISSNSPVCANNTLVLSSGTASNVTGYAWSGPVAITNSATASGSVPSITTAGSGTYTLTVNNGVGSNCTATYTTAVTVPASSPVYSITGGGVYCSGGSGVQVGLSNSASGIQYQLYRGATAVGGTVTGTGTALTFGFQTAAGTYTVSGTNTTTGCVAQMASSTVVSISPPPNTFNVSGGGSYCAGGPGVQVNLSYSDVGASYQLYNGATPMGAAVIGTGAPLTFGYQTAAGTYNVIANPGSSCGLPMAGSATVSINPLPTSYTLTGGGTYCAGGAGVPIGLTFGSSGIQYTLYNGATAVTVVNGANTALSFGNQAAAGIYTVSANNLTTGCVGSMAGSVNVTINPAPTAYSVTGGGAYCSGGTGIAVGLGSSAAGVTYQLYNGSGAVGAAVAGTGSPLSFGNQSAAGIYSVFATGGNGCTTPMSGTATVAVNSAPIAFSVTGGGNLCAGGAGAPIGLAGSALGINYQLYNGATAIATVSGTGSVISLGTYPAPGTYSVLATNPTTGCSTNMSGTAIINVNAVPAAFTVTGSGGYCPGSAGVAVGLGGSASGVSYQLYMGSTAIGTALIGSGFGLSFGNQTTAGTYTVLATNPSSGCTSAMTGSASVSINSLPIVFTVTGGGAYCSGGTGVAIGLSGSTSGVSYQAYLGATTSGTTVAGTGSALSLGLKTAAGAYSVIATNTATNCSSVMTGSAVVSVNPLPAAYNVTGGGGYCTGGAGSAVGLGGSVTGTTYQLYNGGTTVGGPVSGTGAAISFGPQTTAGTYTVGATSGLSCTANMTGSAVVSINTPPTIYSMTGGGAICSSGTGTAIGLPNSTSGVNYQLYNGATAVGAPVAGVTGPISFGNQTAAGTYTVLATNTTTGCTTPMTGAAVISVNASPAAFTVTGGGSYCSGGTGVTVGLGNSSTGVNYQLYNGATAIGSAVPGTGATFTFPTLATTAGTYTVLATAGTCTTAEAGSAVVSINLLPISYSVVGGGSLCPDAAGIPVGLSGSQAGVSYQLYNSSSVSGSSVSGTGSAIAFAPQTAAGTYTVRATNAAGCVNGMSSNAVVVVNPAPTAYAVTGGGSYCSGAGGVSVGLANSSSDAIYYLYNGTSVVGTMIGSGTAFSFGSYTDAGTYTVQGNNTCVANMTGSVTVSILPIPAAQTITGGGGYCPGGTGVNIGLNGSVIGTNYQLYDGSIVSGTAIGGTGLPLDFGPRTAAGTYSVIAINPSTSCINPMTGATTVTINTLPTVFSVTGGGGYCSGSTGVAIGVSGSSSGVTYQLYNGSAVVGGAVAGTGSTVNFGLQTAAGTYSVMATNGAGCQRAMSGTPSVSITPLPTAFVVTGGGSTCAGGAGANVGLNSSTIGVSYQLNVSGLPTGAPVMGTGGAISFGPQTTAGSYNVMATDMTTNCTNYMSGAVNVNVSSGPTAYAVTGGGSMCAGGAGVSVFLTSSDAGINYQLYNGTTTIGTLVAGTGSSLNFGLQTTAGNYVVKAMDPSTSCSGNMSGFAAINVNSAPTAFAVTGGGSYCSGTAGSAVGLANSTGGVNYQLYNGATAIGSVVAGTGSAISFGAQTLTGTYMIQATSSTGCTGPMSGSVTVSVNVQPAAYSVTGGGHYCAGGTGVPVGLPASSSGVTYQLYNGISMVGGAVSGTGGVITFGSQTAAGTYTVLATNTATGCTGSMAGSATVAIDVTPAVQTVTGGGTFCSGGSGIVCGLGNSETGVSYQLYNGTLTAGSPILGTGAAISFGPQTAAGTYNVVAMNTVGCSRNIPGVATIIVTPAPTAYAVTGGGGYCTGGSGVPVGASGSDIGVKYQLYRGSTAVSGLVDGTGSALNFGLQATTGVYTVQASNPSTGCIGGMSGSATVTVNSVPTAYSVLSTGNSYCAGGTGVNVLLSNSDAGVSYQLFNGSVPTGAPVTGSGGLLDFGPQTAAGTYVVVASASGSCASNMSGAASISITSLPALYTITGGGGYCAGTPGAAVGLSGSDTGISYQLFRGTTAVGAPIVGVGTTSGTGSTISFGTQATVGSYVIVATSTTSGCQHTMSGSVSVSTNPLPGLQTVTGGGTLCAGGAGVQIGLANSASGINYQLYNGSSMVGSAIPGTGSAISFGPQAAAGVYTVLAVNGTSCGRNMTGNATIVVNPAPTAYAVTGGGNYCTGMATGVAVGLANSATGFTYQLYNGTTPVSGALAGTGSGLDFGVQSTSGTYTIRATDAMTLCTSTMAGSAIVNANAAPSAHSVTGGGSFCSGGTGVHVGIDGSNTGISYRLYNGATAVGSAMTGTGSTLDFGVITGTGSYTVLATNTTSGCTSAMTGSADVLSVTAVAPSVSISTVSGDTMCLGILTTFNASGVNGGTGATYQWQVNGANVGLGGSTYTYLPANGDVVSVQMNSSLSCATPAAAIALLPVTVLVSQMPATVLNVTPNDTVCMGTAVTLHVTPMYGGSAPAFTWKNGAGATLATGTTSYSYTPSNGDVVYVQMSSNYRCRLADNVESIHTTMVIDSPVAPVVMVTPPSNFKEGETVTLIASVSNGGRDPQFQWYVRSAPVAGATTSVFTSSSLVSGDSVTCMVTKISSCAPITGAHSAIVRSTEGVSGMTFTNSDIRLLPNPNTGDFVIRGTVGNADDQNFVAEITDMLGQVIYKDNVSAHSGNINQHISLSNTLANGMYMLTLRSATESKVFHFVIGK